MKFIRAFELYQVRWTIEVLNKECKGYLNLGSYQGKSLNGQIADCTLCLMTYTMLVLGKRFSDYETMEELFRTEQEQLLAITLWKRLLACIQRLLDCLAEVFGITPEQILQILASDQKTAKKLSVIISALQEDAIENEIFTD